MTVLILSEPNDFHAAAVQWGLRQMDIPVKFWDRSKFSVSSTLSISLAGEAQNIDAAGVDLGIAFRSVWNRRAAKPGINSRLHPSDRHYSHREAVRGIESTLAAMEFLSPTTLWINSRAAQVRADFKPLQLLAAREAGFRVPETLYSNDPQAIRNFHARFGGVVAKSHYPAVWTDQAGTRRWFHTTQLSAKDLSSDFSLFACPMIYQEKLNIDYEIRVVVMGASVLAVRRDRVSRDDVPAEVCDIRVETAISSPYVVDAMMKSSCLAYMRELGISYAAFDFAVCTGGEVFFLEANESGQFLFLEYDVKEIPALDAFCKFLASGDPDFEYAGGKDGIKLSEYSDTSECASFINGIHEVWSGKFPASFEFDEILRDSEAR